MSVFIHSIATCNPNQAYTQQEALEFIKQQYPEGSMAQRIVHRIYTHSDIETRYSVIEDIRQKEAEHPFFDFNDAGERIWPDTKKRNDLYTLHARGLLKKACSTALQHSGYQPKDITHLITVSCTGFYAPGPDYHLIKDLELSHSVQRYHIGFMGCYAAFTALRLAKNICEAQPEAVVLIGDIELCSLHLQAKNETDAILSASIFADGCAGLVVSAQSPKNGLKILDLAADLLPTGEADMAWTIGNQGFDMVLTSYVPKILEAELGKIINPYLEKLGLAKCDFPWWAIHPGGKAILDKAEQALNLQEHHLKPSRDILREFGNMSSVTILYILKRIMEDKTSGKPFPAIAFGPGLTVEMGVFETV